MLGADVSYAAPRAHTPSIAALTTPIDRLGARYATTYETNSFRVEIITLSNIASILKPLI